MALPAKDGSRVSTAASGQLRAALDAQPPERASIVDRIAERLHPVMGVLGIIFVLLVLAEILAQPGALANALRIAGYVIWAIFVAEFLLRLVIAPDVKVFLRRNWWQLFLLVLPVLSFLRLFTALRIARAGRIVSAGIRGTRSARATLAGRLAWLAAVHVIVVLTSSQLLYEFAGIRPYSRALYAAAYAGATGERFVTPEAGTVARIAQVALATYSVAFFGFVAGSLGSYLLERRTREAAEEALADPAPR